MEFTKTGAVPLDIDVRAEGPRPGISEALDLSPSCARCMDDLSQFCRNVRKEGKSFTIVLGPVLPDIVDQDPRVRAVIANRKEQFRALAKGCDAQLFDVTDFAALDDSCFANSLHLNAQGMSAMTAQLERFRRGELMSKGTSLVCGGLHLATTSGTGKQQASLVRAKSD